jgi:hypothetical protein
VRSITAQLLLVPVGGLPCRYLRRSMLAMKSNAASLFAVCCFVSLLAAPAFAQRYQEDSDSDSDSNSDSNSDRPQNPSASAPELDTSVAGSAAVLLAGGLALATARRREQ